MMTMKEAFELTDEVLSELDGGGLLNFIKQVPGAQQTATAHSIAQTDNGVR